MKKISTLAVALMTLGSLVTPAQAQSDVFTPVSSIDESGWYEIRQVVGVYNSANISLENPMYLSSSAELLKNYSYIATSNTQKEDATAYFYVAKNGANYSIKGLNGKFTNALAKPSDSQVTINITPITSNENKTFTIGRYWDDWKDGYMGGSTNGRYDKAAFQFSKVSEENIAAKYDKYTVSISSLTQNADVSKSSLTLNSSVNKGITKVFDGGYFFVTKGTTLHKTDFNSTEKEGFYSSVEIDDTKKTISLVYNPNLSSLAKLITSAKELTNVRGIGYPTESSNAYKAIHSMIESAEAVNTDEEASIAYATLENQMNVYRTKSKAADIQLPEDGKVYRIYAKWSDKTKVYAVNDGKSVESGYYVSGSTTTRTDKSDLWIVQKDGAAFKFASAKADRLFIYKDQKGSASTVDFYMTLSRLSGLGVLNITTDKANTTNICMKKNGDCTGQFTSSGTAHNNDWSTEWFFEEVSETDFAGQPVTFTPSTDNKNYATLNLPYASTLPTGVTAYTATVEGTTVNLTEYRKENQVLPANTPVLLTATSAGEKTFAPAAYVAADNTTGFKGTLAATAVTDANVYILSKNGGKTVKFFALDETNNTINANKAYLVVSKGTNAQALNFNFGNTTGIQNAAVEGVNANAPLFDLSGRRVVKAVKGGIYIQNGKKFVK